MRTTTLARRFGSVAIAATLSLGVASCGDDADNGSDSSSQEGGSDAELEELSADEFQEAIVDAMFEAETFEMEATSTSDGAETRTVADVRFAEDEMAMKATVEDPTSPMEMLLVDQKVYMKGDSLEIGDKWMVIDLNDENSLWSMFTKSMDPKLMYEAMDDPKELELLGQEEIDGVETNHYRVTVDPESYMEAMDFPAMLQQFMPEEVVSEMWIDADDLPRKFSQTVTTPAIAGQPETTTETEGFYRDFGKDVEIEAPPSDEVTDAPFPQMP